MCDCFDGQRGRRSVTSRREDPHLKRSGTRWWCSESLALLRRWIPHNTQEYLGRRKGLFQNDGELDCQQPVQDCALQPRWVTPCAATCATKRISVIILINLLVYRIPEWLFSLSNTAHVYRNTHRLRWGLCLSSCSCINRCSNAETLKSAWASHLKLTLIKHDCYREKKNIPKLKS